MNNISRKLTSTLRKCLRTFATQVKKANNDSVTRREYLQFSKSKLTDFGELPHGEIPEALKTSRPTIVRKLENGVRIGG
jgi:processing peptidase subunit beta